MLEPSSYEGTSGRQPLEAEPESKSEKETAYRGTGRGQRAWGRAAACERPRRELVQE